MMRLSFIKSIWRGWDRPGKYLSIIKNDCFYEKILFGFPGLLSLHCRQKNCHVTYR